MSKLSARRLARLVPEAGQGNVEYGLILVMVSVVAFAALQLLGTNVSTLYNSAANLFAAAV